jgi:hypothetical protein
MLFTVTEEALRFLGVAGAEAAAADVLKETSVTQKRASLRWHKIIFSYVFHPQYILLLYVFKK